MSNTDINILFDYKKIANSFCTCPKNSEINAISSSVFKKCIKHYPQIYSNDDPPLYATVIEADITKKGKDFGK